jgi:hypothetical protein
MVSANAHVLKYVGASLAANSGMNVAASSVFISVSVVLNANSNVVASAVPFKAASFVANAVSSMPTLQAEVNKKAAFTLNSTSGITARPAKIVTMLPITMSAKREIAKCQAINPLLIDGITMLGFPNELGIDV